MSENLKDGNKILVDQAVLELLIKTIICLYVLINNSRTAWPTKILINATFEFLTKFASGCFCYFSKQCWGCKIVILDMYTIHMSYTSEMIRR